MTWYISESFGTKKFLNGPLFMELVAACMLHNTHGWSLSANLFQAQALSQYVVTRRVVLRAAGGIGIQ